MADPQKYDRAAAFEMLQKEHGEYVSPDQINKELDSYEKANGLGAPVEQTAPVTGSAPPPLTAQDKSIAAQAENYALVPSTARETVNTITAPPVGSTSLPDVASAAWGNLSTPEKYAVGGGAAALGSLVTYGAKKPIDRTRDISMSDTKPPLPPPPPPEGPKLSAVDQQIMDRQAINRKVREDYLNRTVGGTPTPEVVAQTPEEIRIAKQAAAAQAAQQSMAAPPPANTPKKIWEPPTASLALNAPATPTQIAAPVAEPISTTPVTAAQTAATTATETSAPKATLEQQVKAIKETATPIATPEKQPPAKAPEKAKMQLPEGWGKGMTWLANQHGVDGAQAFVDQYNNGKPFATHKEMEDKYREVTIRPKYSDIPKDLRRERNIPLRSDLKAVPPPSLRPSDIGQGGGSLIRSLTDPLQLKQ